MPLRRQGRSWLFLGRRFAGSRRTRPGLLFFVFEVAHFLALFVAEFLLICRFARAAHFVGNWNPTNVLTFHPSPSPLLFWFALDPPGCAVPFIDPIRGISEGLARRQNPKLEIVKFLLGPLIVFEVLGKLRPV